MLTCAAAMTEATPRYNVRPLRSADDEHQELENLLCAEQILETNLRNVRLSIAATRERIAATPSDQAGG